MVLGALGKIGPIAGSGLILTIAALTLSGIYFFFGFAIFTGIGFRGIIKNESYKHLKPYDIIISVFAGMAFQSVVMGLLFQLQYWPGAGIMTVAAILSLIIFIMISPLMLRTKNKYVYMGILKRGIPMLLVLLFLYFSPVATKLKIFKVGSPEIEVQILNDAKESGVEN